MNEATIEAIAKELSEQLIGQKFGKIFPLGKLRMAIDFRLPGGNYLFVSVEPAAPRLYLIERRLKDLEKQSQHSAPFVLFLRKRLANATLAAILKDAGERVVRFVFDAEDELGNLKKYALIAQLTGRSANLFLLDENGFVLDALRETQGAGQQIAENYAPPVSGEIENENRKPGGIFPKGNFKTLSEALDAHFQRQEAETEFQARAKSELARIKQEIGKREKLKKKLAQDLAGHGDAERWKRSGDLLLANLATAERRGNKVSVTDFYDENAPTVEIEVDENLELTGAAEKFFKRYAKAKRAAEEIEKRLVVLDAEIAGLTDKRERVEQAIEEKDAGFFAEIFGAKSAAQTPKLKEKKADEFTGARRYRSSDGFEILVGKASKDNDYLTFRVAKSLDFWLHAADYGGSHVVVRNPNRAAELPHKTLVEAAELAAFFSQARSHSKAAVNYTQKKFVNKPKGAAPGLVSLSSFKTVLVEPKVGLERNV